MSAFDELVGLASLPANWESCGAHEVTENAISSASALLRNPRVSATPGGGVNITWENVALSVDVSILPDGSFGDSTVERFGGWTPPGEDARP